ncbi:MAG: lytic transglycosylase domain-containing protein [Gammaproteobacteria bacterium]|nr:lytic transglycosylase domain-containing protein [Gammaproteobacteria bacterium]MBQ0840728.1 lytic transglycosylase domain-containing protein [Gammaproteobacteria bacterium]
MPSLKRSKPSHYLSLLALLLTTLLVAPSALSAQTSDPELLRILRDTASQADSFDDRYDAEVWLLTKSNSMARFLPDKNRRFEFLRKVHRAATRAGLQPEIVLALIEVESHFDTYAVSSAGAQGLMQVMPFWKKEIGRPDDNLTNTDTNLRYGCTILKHYLNREKGRLADALARYNGSYGQYWYSERVLLAWEKRWR